MDVYKPVYPGLYYFDTFTFTTLGTSGHRGPDSTKTYANAPWSADQFSIVNGQQQWTVPATGTYHVEAAGAYGVTPGRVVSGDVNLNEGQTLTMLVGQQPNPLVANVADNVTVGGGGGTFIGSNGKLLMTASGGDGTGGSAASFSPYGTGNGKNGGGYLSNGLATNATFKFLTPAAYVDGGFGTIFPTGVVPEEGGFGGGQAPVTSGISGGGGYTGSPGDGVSGATCYADPSVVNFKDLGAASNTAGYVTVSLIDPVPLKQKWTWDQTFTNTAPKAPYELVSWSDKLSVFQSATGTSSDGINWNSITINDISNGGQSPFPFYIAYSDTLSLYISVELGASFGSIKYVISNDGIIWTETTPVGLDLNDFGVFTNGSSILWASELSLFVFLGNTRIWSSIDGINWTERYSEAGFYTKSITYSPSLHTFVCNCSAQGIGYAGLYSTNGVTWNTWSVTGLPNICESVTWSPKLEIFVASIIFIETVIVDGVDTYNYYSNIAHSTDGQTWSTVGFNVSHDTGILYWNVIWGENLNIFTAIHSYSYYGYNMYSYDGISWSVIRTPVYGRIAYSPTLKIFVVANTKYERFISIDGIYYVNIQDVYPSGQTFFTWASQIGKFVRLYNGFGFTSSDAIKWEQNASSTSNTPSKPVWSPELGLFVSLTSLSYYYSYDGITWTVADFSEPALLPYVAWSSKLGAFSGSYYSKDGKNWTRSMDFTAIGWSSFYNTFVAFFQTEVYYSYDGIIWNTGSNPTGIDGTGNISCSSSGRLVCSGTSTGVLYSDDGINWQFSDIGFVCVNPIWVEELTLFVGSVASEETIGCLSTDGINWSTNYLQIGEWSPELGRFLCTGGYSYVNKSF